MSFGVDCAVEGCPKEARWQIGFRIWPIGADTRNLHKAIEGMTGKCVCDEHAIRDPEKFFTPAGKERMAVGFLNAGRGMPDFSTAQIVHTEISGGEPITMEEARHLGGFPDA